MAARAPMLPPANETEHSSSRITREGKRITYKLTVMQQPERARACGAGAKSSADRRPVDPPPVVELRVLESDPNDDARKTDVTFAFNANFFLYATLETACPIAPGRTSGIPTCPVLTGVPVAGVAYLDRPSQAGYFIFPDLSVRREGRYRLSFHLYEETKDPKDADKDSLPPQTSFSCTKSSKPQPPQTYLNFRLDVKSKPFTVYSAKKFPGLATSTSLSRIIAEQGCRVRIRRDVRMRRRGDNKPAADDYEYEEERLYGRTSRYTTPDTYAATPIERPRSTSNGPVEHPFPYPVDASRRPSIPEYGYHCQQPYRRHAPPVPSGPPPPVSHAQQSHLSFGSAPPPYPGPQLAPAPPSAAPQISYPSHPSYMHSRNDPNGSEFDSASVAYPFASRPQESPSYPKTALPPLLLEPPKPMQVQPFGERRSSDPNAYQSALPSPASRSQTPINMMPSLPPLKTLATDYPVSQTQPMTSIPQSPIYDMTPTKRPLYDPESVLSKRSHTEFFGHDEEVLKNGMRPSGTTYPSVRQKQSGACYPPWYKDTRSEMEYKRANGKIAMKIHPNP
ncbi:hypothetical protein MAP00_004948 [Monascus purpureus]|nr:hypothetical protein MAP00_004948 [Monascus purpureus]